MTTPVTTPTTPVDGQATPLLEHRIARVLTIGTWVGFGLLSLGVVAMVVAGISPLDPVYPPLHPADLAGDLADLVPASFLWLGLIVVLATPLLACRVGLRRLREAGRADDGPRVGGDPRGHRHRRRGRLGRRLIDMGDIAILILAFAVILVGAELFTNGIEWFGRKLELAEGVVGSVLAAVGTALPETMIPIIAIVFVGGAASTEVGVGAILGAPFMLATLAMFVTGVAVIAVRRREPDGDRMTADPVVMAYDLRYFALAYALAIGAAFLPPELGWAKLVVAAVLIGIYAWYVKGHFEADSSVDLDDLTPLRFHRLDRRSHRDDPGVPRLRVVNVQVLFALGCIVVGAYAFVGAVEDLAHTLGADEALLALVIAPIATELPEKFNSVIWVRARKDTLAMGNITGAMVFQSTFPTVVALVFAGAAWTVTPESRIAFASAAIAFLSIGAILLPALRRGNLTGRRLLVGGVFYLLYLGLVLGSLVGWY